MFFKLFISPVKSTSKLCINCVSFSCFPYPVDSIAQIKRNHYDTRSSQTSHSVMEWGGWTLHTQAPSTFSCLFHCLRRREKKEEIRIYASLENESYIHTETGRGWKCSAKKRQYVKGLTGAYDKRVLNLGEFDVSSVHVRLYVQCVLPDVSTWGRNAEPKTNIQPFARIRHRGRYSSVFVVVTAGKNNNTSFTGDDRELN